MLTGDSRTTARGRRRSLGIDEVRAEVLPDQKGRGDQAAPGRGTASSPWPATVSTMRPPCPGAVGIAMGTGTDVAMESAGVTLVKGDLRGSCAPGA